MDGFNPPISDDDVLGDSADNYFEYNSDRRVTKEVVYGGSQTFLFDDTPSGNTSDYNPWAMKTVETLQDGSEMKVYTNFIGEVLLKELSSDGDRWIEYYQFDGAGHEILRAEPSAISNYINTLANLG
ncbi:hypothetical protein DTL42_17190 [Bremerella cremea]|uniref:Uncharacterized protein n=1 Tax=Bremerella cremea TaxID=1031537 RepID=A0A368KRR4_9BACT|nr:hypothetical protein [Bremerella cremea]RCS44657.1 hypothetical protein DTL42_17190 [Bremerella cremea]